MMARFYQVSVVLFFAGIFLFAGCNEKETPTALSSSAQLWNDGQWTLYDLNRTNTDGVETLGTLKVSSVGNEVVEGKTYFWLELREDSKNGVKITKFLAREKNSFNPDSGFTFWEDVKRIIIQKDTGKAEEVPSQHLRRYSPHFIEGSGAKRYGNIEDIDPPEVEILDAREFTVNNDPISVAGKRNVQHFSSAVNLGFLNLEDTTESSVEYYRSTEIPFGGIVSVDFSSITTSVNKLKPDAPPKPPKQYKNSMRLKSYGSGAESQIIGDPIEMEVMPFPFLEAARKNASKTK
ncbi:hypothetical protein K8T06_06360 [bacterium]|nr:hypothetical protein [bacterium]